MASCTKWILNIHLFTIWIKNEELPVDHTFWWPILRKKFHEIFTLVWEAISKTRASCFIRGSKHLETIKALGLRPRAFICFSVFGTPDETLALVFDIITSTLFPSKNICRSVAVVYSNGFTCNRILLFTWYRSRPLVDMKTLPKVERFQNDTVLFFVQRAKPHRFEYVYYFSLKFAYVRFKVAEHSFRAVSSVV